MPQKKILQSRVSEELYDKISKKAKQHRITVSNLIRNLVEDVAEIHDELSEIVDKKVRKTLFEGQFGDVLGYQLIVLNKDRECDYCKKVIKKGSDAFTILFDDSGRKHVICGICKFKMTRRERKV